MHFMTEKKTRKRSVFVSNSCFKDSALFYSSEKGCKVLSWVCERGTFWHK